MTEIYNENANSWGLWKMSNEDKGFLLSHCLLMHETELHNQEKWISAMFCSLNCPAGCSKSNHHPAGGVRKHSKKKKKMYKVWQGQLRKYNQEHAEVYSKITSKNN